MRARTVSRTLSAVLVFQLGIGVLLVLGDMRDGALRLPGLRTDAPRLTEPVRPGDQRRTYTPSRDRPATAPARDPGTLPDRLTLTFDDGTWRLEGAIAEGDAARLIPQIEAADPPVETLVLQSPGGSVRDALDLGRHLRAAGIGTTMLPGEFCYSACPYLLAGGTPREIAPSASVGVHQHYFGESTILPAFVAVEDIQRGQGEVMTYLDEMGIDPLVMRHALTTPADEIYILLPEELRRYGFLPEEG
ncbi:hypothetical protein [Pseudoponticoccus marisrubri]|uniref:Periplasmic protein-like protein n=1 Tax=Pseudoponticoccus marisrubri TaxID=1685382 RepID=A0A0W7WP47_9RHOB|nr:hypothetical protein [Pseudoponticoccus marisrubri]KUF12264.1 hypothetical protein AVJ23_00575 [Pseudoponticoccus marisrubri]